MALSVCLVLPFVFRPACSLSAATLVAVLTNSPSITAHFWVGFGGGSLLIAAGPFTTAKGKSPQNNGWVSWMGESSDAIRAGFGRITDYYSGWGEK
ncbi:hypothetical protein DdX_04456 [Ditylenchus destructor]|uniref:Uncharacterized protein n=1 Tax=Ditylenchus destructor TaxID=166010 RepID=A0AAD4R4I8_9BILA|nr:hypothetical protein DdX_04456 [Ditylenchus destructor]